MALTGEWQTESAYLAPSWVSAGKMLRARKRLPDVIGTANSRIHKVCGRPEMGDAHQVYVVAEKMVDGKLRHNCSCQSHPGGEFRGFCTHILAVMIWKRVPREVVNGGVIESRSGNESILPVVEERGIQSSSSDSNTGWDFNLGSIPSAPAQDPAVEEEETPEPEAPRGKKQPRVLTAEEALAKVVFPAWASELRPMQVEKVKEIYNLFQSHKIVIAELPTGSGKTIIADTVRQMLDVRAIYVCTTKTLQDQVLKDFPSFRVIKGRANYPTHNYPHRFRPTEAWREFSDHLSTAECTYGEIGECGWCETDPNEPMSAMKVCPYNRAKWAAQKATVAVLNTAYFLGSSSSPTAPHDLAEEDGRVSFGFVDRGLVILDEADTLEGELLNFIQVEIGKKRMDQLGIGPPDKRTVSSSWQQWVKDIALPALSDKVKVLKENKKMDPVIKLRQVKAWDGLLDKLSGIHDSLESGWVYSGYEEGKGNVEFKPIRVNKMGQGAIWNHGKRFLVMSATIIDPNSFAYELGLNPGEWGYVCAGSSFKKERRPVTISSVGEMTYKAKDVTKPKMVEKVIQILNKFPDDRSLIHTVSYDLTSYLYTGLRKELGSRVLTYANAATRQSVLEQYREMPGAVLLAPSMERGVDLKGDECRLQILCKLPFPYLGDKQVNARLYCKGGNLWYKIETIRAIVQMTGRAMRSENDWCRTFILDGSFMKLWKENRHLFPRWWQEAVRFDDYDVLEAELQREYAELR